QALLGQGPEILVVPPRLDHVMVGEDTAACGHKKPRPQRMHQEFWPSPFEREYGITLVVQRRSAVRSEPGIMQVPRGGLLLKTHCQMNQANARGIGANDLLSQESFRVGLAHARSGLLEPAAQTGSFGRRRLADFGRKFL